MGIEDSNPERRNLVVLSMAIIAFYVGGCEIPASGDIELPLIKLKFTDAYHLAWLVWITLFWFVFRYFVESKVKMINSFHDEINDEQYLSSILSRYYFPKVMAKGYKNLSKDTFKFFHSIPEENRKAGKTGWLIVCFQAKSVVNGKVETGSMTVSGYAKLIYPILALRIVFIKPSVSANLAPIMMFIVAIGFGLSQALTEEPAKDYYLDVNKFLIQSIESEPAFTLK